MVAAWSWTAESRPNREIDAAELSIRLSFVFVLYGLAMCLFALFHPVLEWPDAQVHLENACQKETVFPPDVLLRLFGQDVCSLQYFAPTGDFRFFSDQSSYSDVSALNPIWAYIALPLLCLALLFPLIAILGNRDASGNEFLFAPPLAFYFSNVNVEVFGLFVVVAGYFLLRTRPSLSIFLAVLATAIDRSHFCSLLTLFLLHFFRDERRAGLYRVFILCVLAAYVARTAGFFPILDWIAPVFSQISLLGITDQDILYNAEFGGRGYAALLASSAGLYGAMSYRPVLWILYYGLFFSLVCLGYNRTDPNERRVFWISLATALSVMIILPPLSQARYYPFLILSMWSMAMKGGRSIGLSSVSLQLLFFLWTAVSVIAANLSHIVQA